MPNTPNGVYAFRPWQAHPMAAYPPQAYIGPFASNQERLLTQSMEIGNMSASEIQEYVRPNLPQVKLFPERFGYETAAYGIRDIVEMNGRPTQRTDFSGEPTTTESTSRNTLGAL